MITVTFNDLCCSVTIIVETGRNRTLFNLKLDYILAAVLLSIV